MKFTPLEVDMRALQTLDFALSDAEIKLRLNQVEGLRISSMIA
jgi:hypothetical protein